MDLSTDFLECVTTAHQRWQVLGSTDEVGVEHAWEYPTPTLQRLSQLPSNPSSKNMAKANNDLN